jgi:uncharacterized Zn ribbon protein
MANNHCKNCNSIVDKYDLDIMLCGDCIKERRERLEQKAWENMTGEDVANNLSREEANEYYLLLGR